MTSLHRLKNTESRALTCVWDCFIGMLPSVLCILYTHLRILDFINTLPDFFGYAPIILTACFDACLLTSLLLIVCKGKYAIASVLSFTCLLLWGVVSVVYLTYFGRYPVPSLLCEVSNLSGMQTGTYIIDALKICDLMFVVLTIIEVFCYKYLSTRGLGFKDVVWPFISYIVFYLAVVSFGKLFLYHEQDYMEWPTKEAFRNFSLVPRLENVDMYPIKECNIGGIFRCIIYMDIYRHCYKKEIPSAERQQIESLIETQGKEYSNTLKIDSVKRYKRVIFILAESYLADTSGKSYGGYTVTPFLDDLRSRDDVAYNDSVISNAQLGASSDGQFIYMTGLAPLRDRLTISIIDKHPYYTLPGMLKKSGFKTLMTIPTEASFWRQDEACKIYNIDKLYSNNNLSNDGRWMEDEEIFAQSLRTEKREKTPNIHVILTVSTHSPYDKTKAALCKCACYPRTFPQDMGEEYRYYLLSCHYMDHQIRKFFYGLAKEKMLKESLIIIASDHGWEDSMHTPPANVDKNRISAMFVNVPKLLRGYRGAVNQIDVYTSLVDLLQSTGTITSQDKHHWYGFGKSLFRTGWPKQTLNDKIWGLSEDIICGDYIK